MIRKKRLALTSQVDYKIKMAPESEYWLGEIVSSCFANHYSHIVYPFESTIAHTFRQTLDGSAPRRLLEKDKKNEMLRKKHLAIASKVD
jgi:hypothetical protein